MQEGQLDILSIICEIATNFLEVLLFFVLVHHKLENFAYPKHARSIVCISILVQTLLMTFLNNMDIPWPITPILFFAIDLVYVFLFFHCRAANRILWCIIFSLFCIISDILTFVIAKALAHIDSTDILYGGEMRIATNSCYISIIAGLVFVAIQLLGKRSGAFRIKIVPCVLISVIGAFTSEFILSLAVNSLSLNNPHLTIGIIVSDVLFLGIFLLLLFYIIALGKAEDKSRKASEELQAKKSEQREYDNITRNIEAIRVMKHDISSHLRVLRKLIDDGRSTDAIKYLDDYAGRSSQYAPIISSGDVAIDAILTDRIGFAKKKDIEVVYSVIIPKPFPLSSVEIVSLLGNLWDNSINASERYSSQYPDKKPAITFYIKPFRDMVLIHIENNYYGEIKWSSDHFPIQNDTSPDHGLGIKRIKALVYEHEGIITMSTEEDRFIVHIMLPLKDGEE